MNTCQECGTPTTNKTWCSRACRQTPAIVTCEWPKCRNTFTTQRSRARHGHDVHCPQHRGPEYSCNPKAKTFVYVAYDKRTGAGKIGVTTRPERRRKQLGRGWEIVIASPYQTRKEALAVESQLLETCTSRGYATWMTDGASETFDPKVDDLVTLAWNTRTF